MRLQRGVVLAPYAALAAGLVVAGLCAALWWQAGKLEEAQAEVRRLDSALSAERQSRAQFEASARDCSQSVAALDKAAQQQRALYELRLGSSAKETAAVQAYVLELLNRPRPAGLDECQAMRKELDDEIARRRARR